MNLSREKIAAVAAEMGIEPEFLEQCLEEEIIFEEHLGAEPRIAAGDAARLRTLHRISRALQVDVFAAEIILELRERLDELERELDVLRSDRIPPGKL
ncbi:MAG: hypothetical protein KGL04_10185 [Elusimicrobia bacterium]|nr:hypothetical protein [Elusimicrobiota bacterium]